MTDDPELIDARAVAQIVNQGRIRNTLSGNLGREIDASSLERVHVLLEGGPIQGNTVQNGF